MRGTIFPATNFDAETVTRKMRQAMRGIGTKEKTIIEILTSHNNTQRQVIKRKYKSIYGRVLSEDVKDELGGHFEVVSSALLSPLTEYLVDCLYFAFKDIEPDEKCIIEILASLEFLELCSVKTAFEEKYHQDLKVFLHAFLDADFQKLVSALFSKDREYNFDVDQNAAVDDAQILLNVGFKNSWNQLLIDLLVIRSKAHARATIATYERRAGHSFHENLKAEFDGTLRNAFLAIVECIQNRSAFFAKQLHKAMSGVDKDDNTIIRILVSRSEVDLADIQDWYHINYNLDLSEALYSDTSGDYRKILMKILDP